MSKGIEEALANCLDNIERGSASVEEALSLYPRLRAELRPLVMMALEMRSMPRVAATDRLRTTGRPVFRPRPAPASLRSRVAAWLAVPPSFGWSPALSRVAAALAACFLVAGGTVVASAGSLPDEPLYPVKLALEEARLAVTPDTASRSELQLQFASRRLEEVEEAARRGNDRAVEKGLALYQEKLESVGRSAETGPGARVDEPEIRASLEQLKSVRDELEARDEARLEAGAPANSHAAESLSRVISAFEAGVAPGSLVKPEKGKGAAAGNEDAASAGKKGENSDKKAPTPTATAAPAAEREVPGKAAGRPDAPSGPKDRGEGEKNSNAQRPTADSVEPAAQENSKVRESQNGKPARTSEALPSDASPSPTPHDNRDGLRSVPSSQGGREK